MLKNAAIFRALAILVSFSSVLLSQLALAELSAQRITSDNALQLIQQGPDAIGGIDDWFISNGTLCAVFSDVSHEGEFSSKGGILIDLGFCDRADDHYTSAQDVLDGQRTRPMDVEHMESNVIDGNATLTTTARSAGVMVKTRYSLNEAEPTQLSISKKITLTGEDSPSFNFYSPFWFNYHSLETYVYSTRNPSASIGFSNVDFVTRGSSAIRESTHSADVVILPSPPEAEAPIAYGWQMKSATRVNGDERYELPAFILTDEESTVFLVLADSFYIGDGTKIGLLQLPQIPLLSLAAGESIELEEVMYVGRSADVASITDQLITTGVSIIGTVADPDSALHVETPAGTPITFVRPDSDGRFEFKAAKGDYRIRHINGAEQSKTHLFAVNDAAVNLGALSLEKTASLTLPRGEAMRLVFVGQGETSNPDFDNRLTEYSVADDDGPHYRDKLSQIFLAGVASDPSSVIIKPGDYRVYATRGPEYEVSMVDISIKSGQTLDLKIAAPAQAITTPGYIASDLHVHTGLSFDNTFSTAERVRTFAAEHGEILVSSEHDVPVDFTPYIESMGVSDKIRSIAAIEATSILPSKSNPYTGGHVNFFPTKPEPLEYRRGGVSNEDRRLRDVLHEMSEKHPEVIAQLNHARLNLSLSGDADGEMPEDFKEFIYDGGYLDHMGVAAHPYNPNKPLDAAPNNSLLEKHPTTGWRDIDIDAMEIMNPDPVYYEQRILALRKDWLSFIKQGHKITGTANSDSHHANHQVAVPRTMVAVKGDSIARFNQSEFLSALRAGKAYGTTGPMLELSLFATAESETEEPGAAESGAQKVSHMGETYQGKEAILRVEITAANWVNVDQLLVQLNGKNIAELDASKQRVFEVEIDTEQDGFVTVEVFGKAGDAYQALYPGLRPYAFSNPIYIDHDSDGQWTPPGL